MVPKFLVGTDGSLGARNDVRCVGNEDKLGLHGSPTCAMGYGEHVGAVAEMIGRENEGLTCMFAMMNSGRVSAGLEGFGVTERAYQQALAYARQRIQGRDEADGAVAIIRHADERARHAALADLMTPVVKGWCIEVGLEIANVAIQVHGGSGYVESTGAAQNLRALIARMSASAEQLKHHEHASTRAAVRAIGAAL